MLFWKCHQELSARFRIRRAGGRGLCLALLLTGLWGLPVSIVPANADEPALLFSDDFESGKTDAWKPTDPTAWELRQQNDNTVMALIKSKSNYEPPVRSPYNRNILQEPVVTDFVFEVKLQSTSRDYNHRSLCLFFGYQDESHFYYVHFGKVADPHANQIFIVNGEPRTKISLTTTKGTPWDDQWHHARIVRDVKSGKIEVYFDDMETPAMTARDKTFTHGRVGIGSFDDPGNFDDFRLYGTKWTGKAAE